ncbi:MAG TPA: hypothetical protein VFV00_03690 [Acidimicrobiales bacterium]|nr:hypothetical protein [Acidimicrobiales bacterium]
MSTHRYTANERHSWVADVLQRIDSAVADLDSAIDALSEIAAPGRAYRANPARSDAS